MTAFEIDVQALQPSQLYICAETFDAVLRSYGSRPNQALDPLPVRRLGSEIVLTDGHTKAFAEFRRDRRLVAAYWDTDELNWEACEICVRWCHEAGIRSIADLAPRVVSEGDYDRRSMEALAREALRDMIGASARMNAPVPT